MTEFDSTAGRVSVIDSTVNSPTVNTVVATVSPLGGCPTGVAIAPSGAFAYVANFTANNAAEINTATNTVLTTVPVGSGARGAPNTPTSTLAYVANSTSNDIEPSNSANNTNAATLPA